MAQTYIIIIQSSATHKAAIAKRIKQYGTWARLTADAWAVKSTDEPVQIRDELMRYAKGDSDRIYVIRSGVVAAWYNTTSEISDWLKDKL